MDNTGEVITASVLLNGEYGLKDMYMGVPCKLDTRGVNKVVEIDLSEQERTAFMKSAKAVKGPMGLLPDAGLVRKPTGEDGAG